MTTEYYLPTVGNQTSSPVVNRSSNGCDVRSTPSTFSQLPSLNSKSRRSSYGKSKNYRLPLSNVEINREDDNKSSEMELDFIEPTKAMANHDVQLGDIKTLNVMELSYPKNPKLPSRSLVEAFYKEAVSNVDDGYETSDQVNLSDAGLLSLEQVLLPAVAYQEEQMLKEWQAIVQRDGSKEQKSTVIKLRKAVYSGIGAACAAVKQSRLQRAVFDQEREKNWQLELQKKLQAEEEIRQQQQQLAESKYHEALRQRQRDLQKKLPANQEVWREVAYLMTELTKLSNEERQWQNVSNQYLDQTEAELERQQKSWEESQHSRVSTVDETKKDIASDTVQQIVGCVTESASDISLAVERIRMALSQVSQTVLAGEQTRQQLYQQYVTNHQFYGYQGVHDPKGLLKVLSQSQSEE